MTISVAVTIFVQDLLLRLQQQLPSNLGSRRLAPLATIREAPQQCHVGFCFVTQYEPTRKRRWISEQFFAVDMCCRDSVNAQIDREKEERDSVGSDRETREKDRKFIEATTDVRIADIRF